MQNSPTATPILQESNPSLMVAPLESLLFAAGEPVGAKELARALDCEISIIPAAIDALQQRLTESESALQVIEIAGGWQLSTRPEFAHIVGRLLSPNANKLTRPALETVTIIAYRQPCTQAEIEAIRGVACGGVLRTLEDRALIKEIGRRPTPGRPILYGTTDSFLHHFGMSSLSQLPALEEDEQPSLPFDKGIAIGAAGFESVPEPQETEIPLQSETESA